MGNQTEWKAKLAFACYLALVGAVLLGSIILALVLFGLRIDYLDLPFPIAIVALPINETIFLGVTLLFARYKHAGLKNLGLKKVNLKILTIVSVSAVLLFFLATIVSALQETILGPDPTSELLAKSIAPRNPLQLVALIALSLGMVGPCEELAFRGFVQKGFENSFGKMKSLLIASLLFGLLHGLNSPYAIVPIFAISLILGYVWQQTGGNTTASALVHGIYDSIGIAIVYFATLEATVLI